MWDHARGPLKAEWRLYGAIEGCKGRFEEVSRLLDAVWGLLDALKG